MQSARPEFDVDPNGAVGTKQYMEWVNVYFQAYDKIDVRSGVVLGADRASLPGRTTASRPATPSAATAWSFSIAWRLRWVIAARIPSRNNYNYCVAVSNTDDLTSNSLKWYTYVFSLNSVLGTNAQGDVYFPDWPKIAAWPDAYYVALTQ